MHPTITPQDFAHKWRQSQVKGRTAYQGHFIDLCHLVGHSTPTEAELELRTLTKLYNERPTWLDANGWPHDLTDEHILTHLLTLNLERARQP